jgi:hypothetical protein
MFLVVSKSTTIALTKKVQKKLLVFIHIQEKQTGKRLSYSDAIEILLTKYKE